METLPGLGCLVSKTMDLKEDTVGGGLENQQLQKHKEAPRLPGFSRKNERIIEIALLDLQGGENSMFQTLVNRDHYVPNTHIHGISTLMVCRSDVSRMEELIPILLQYVKSREKPGAYVVFVAHNARTFDVPFLTEEFSRCSYEIPSNWFFLDTLPLASEMMKSGGSMPSSGLSLELLRDYYKIPLAGSAHRVMSDVKVVIDSSEIDFRFEAVKV